MSEMSNELERNCPTLGQFRSTLPTFERHCFSLLGIWQFVGDVVLCNKCHYYKITCSQHNINFTFFCIICDCTRTRQKRRGHLYTRLSKGKRKPVACGKVWSCNIHQADEW